MFVTPVPPLVLYVMKVNAFKAEAMSNSECFSALRLQKSLSLSVESKPLTDLPPSLPKNLAGRPS